ncbi:hypothetical protein C488_03360 [Natrinema pellirubrum DSM 15624]|uniref:Membrane protein n=1 Tax=Natrinema pellirubrum (strain DSM 15624 / CIP 106293 / JCM 10476 / NCIMB 786 / 157) TaxID=797303 RepID=L0JH37_NATP1|nr:DUF106 domain-containing protein [Natrinema pellirubrum]AGB30820.1 putative membrane protein [Natrinema pellirubrum DSM 15624]ELY80794.1 hypothetical protein C488_03360 [Natrinema pellirubrum DSM 15624]
MTRTAEKIDALVREDSSMAAALEAIREEADRNGGEVQWADVSDDLTSGQWGRLIEKGVLVDGDDGFEIADREAFDRALDGDGDGGSAAADIEIDEEQSSWSQWDKLAGVGALLLMPGYWFDSIRNVVGSTLDLALGPLDAALPFYAVILSVALITGLYSSLLQANLMNPEIMAKYQERMKAVQEEQKDLRQEKKEAEERGASEAEIERLENEIERAREEQMEAMADNLGMFKEQFRPMVWIMLFTIPMFLWMYWKMYGGISSEMVVIPLAGEVSWGDRLQGFIPVWLFWYFLCSMACNQLIRKALDINMSPS